MILNKLIKNNIPFEIGITDVNLKYSKEFSYKDFFIFVNKKFIKNIILLGLQYNNDSHLSALEINMLKEDIKFFKNNIDKFFQNFKNNYGRIYRYKQFQTKGYYFGLGKN